MEVDETANGWVQFRGHEEWHLVQAGKIVRRIEIVRGDFDQPGEALRFTVVYPGNRYTEHASLEEAFGIAEDSL